MARSILSVFWLASKSVHLSARASLLRQPVNASVTTIGKIVALKPL